MKSDVFLFTYIGNHRNVHVSMEGGYFSLSLDPVYSTEVVTKLRQKEQTQSFINKPCSLFITERSFIIFDRGTQVSQQSFKFQ